MESLACATKLYVRDNGAIILVRWQQWQNEVTQNKTSLTTYRIYSVRQKFRTR